MWKFVRWTAGLLLGLVLVLALAGWAYVESLDLETEPRGNPAATAADLAFVREGVQQKRGRILAVLSSTARFDQGRRKGGYELTELSRAYWVFIANGYEVDLASPRGGTPPQVLDEDLIDADYAFLNDPAAQAKLAATIPLAEVDPSRYDAVYFVGGKGAMFDFPGNEDIARIVRDIQPRGVVGAVCHGPAALLDITLADGTLLLQGRRVTGFSNAEELFLIEDARTAFPFLLQEALAAQSAGFVEGPMYLDNTVVDGRLVTGQNPLVHLVGGRSHGARAGPRTGRPRNHPRGNQRGPAGDLPPRRSRAGAGRKTGRTARQQTPAADARAGVRHAVAPGRSLGTAAAGPRAGGRRGRGRLVLPVHAVLFDVGVDRGADGRVEV
ncbi:type 1 glutamine amidotransferase domain-containing protein [Arenimonas daejeonensis]|uniref:type 1 glutamine amidotransferase domain-containing protein n=1 Tax=Arenimonas daejeonensis TaxID=370777 RepID=UPI0013150DEE|nr:type 1 glutamine amidotransferase domain-containing protein [Arenimonas daejeonensis]